MFLFRVIIHNKYFPTSENQQSSLNELLTGIEIFPWDFCLQSDRLAFGVSFTIYTELPQHLYRSQGI